MVRVQNLTLSEDNYYVFEWACPHAHALHMFSSPPNLIIQTNKTKLGNEKINILFGF